MWLMMQQPEPDDFVLASGETHSVREFVELAFARVGITVTWQAKKGSVDEEGVDDDGKTIVKVDPKYFRPTEVDLLLGDASKAKSKLGWEPKISFPELVNEMVDFEMKALR
jgi:GDPmannose 4,6-dehydratase